MANHDRFGNLVDDNGHDILEDEVLYLDEEDDYDEDFEPIDDFPFGLEYEDEYYTESYMTGDSDLANEF